MASKKKILLLIAVVILGLVVTGGLYIYQSYEKVHVNEDDINKEDRIEAAKYKEVKGISNILLVGVDARADEPTRSDAITILTIDDVHKKLKLTSIMRDALVNIPGHGNQKIAHAHSYGKIQLLRKTIEQNFDIRLDDYAIINFNGFKELIDAVGGIEGDIKNKDEVKELNRCIDLEIEDNPKLSKANAIYIKEPGKQLLNGQQALAFSRMRHVGNGTYDRVRRQREVLEQLILKTKNVSVLKYPSIANKLLPYLKTNIGITDVLNLAYTAQKINNFNIEKLQIPTDKLSDGLIINDEIGWVHVMDKEKNKKVMHDFIFEDIKYDENKYKQFKYVGERVKPKNVNNQEHKYDNNKPSKQFVNKQNYNNKKSQVQKPQIKPTEKPTVKPYVKPDVKPTENPTVKPDVKPTEKPTVKPDVKPTENPTVKPDVKPAKKGE